MKSFRTEAKLLALATVIGALLTQFGVKLDLAWYNETVNLVVTLLTLIGVVVSAKNNPTTKGIELIKKK